MDDYAIRRENLRYLIATMYKSAAAFGRSVGVPGPHVSRWLADPNKPTKKSSKRNIEAETARLWEEKIGLPRLWFETLQSGGDKAVGDANAAQEEDQQNPESAEDRIEMIEAAVAGVALVAGLRIEDLVGSVESMRDRVRAAITGGKRTPGVHIEVVKPRNAEGDVEMKQVK